MECPNKVTIENSFGMGGWTTDRFSSSHPEVGVQQILELSSGSLLGKLWTHTCVMCFFFHDIWFIVYCFKVLKNRLKHVDLYTKFVWLSSMRIPMFVGKKCRDSQGALFRSWFFLLKIPRYDMYWAAPSTRTWTLLDCSSWDTKVRTEPTERWLGWVMPPVDEHQGSKDQQRCWMPI